MATITVTNDNDSGTGSLRAALLAAAAGDTINFASNVTTIDLDSSLVIGKNVTIEGAQPGSTTPGVTINGGGSSSNFSDFTVDAGVSATFDGLIIADGNAKGAAGKEFVGNYGVSGSGAAAAGGIYVKGDLTLTNTFLQGDTATGGAGGAGTDGLNDGGGAGGSAAGAIYVAHTGSLDLAANDVFGGNSATGGAGGQGGAGYTRGNYYSGGAAGAGGVSSYFAVVAGGVTGVNGGSGAGGSGPDAGAGGAPAEPGSRGRYGAYGLGAGGGGGGGTAFADVGGKGIINGTATTDVVTNNGDDVEGDIVGSLRYVLAHANPGDTITFEPSVTTIDLAKSLVISKNVTIEGLQPGATTPGVTINGGGGNHDYPDFTINGGVTASIDGLVIANGYNHGAAGPAFDGNYVGRPGGPAAGGIFDSGALTLTNSVLQNDTAVGGSAARFSGGAGGTAVGGIYVAYGASLDLASNDAFSGNSAIGGTGGQGFIGLIGVGYPDYGGYGGSGGFSFVNNGVGQPGSPGPLGAPGGAPGEPGGSLRVRIGNHYGSYYAASPGGGGGGGFAFANIAGAGTITGYVACYCRGTLIATACGEQRVEELKVGDKVMTASGALRPIKWIGRRSYSGRFIKGSKEILPICIKAGALDENTPRRDLWISAHHAMYLDGVLIEAKDLVNGVSIVQAEQVETVEYFHIELDSHDVIVAEGALSETYLDDDNRAMFHNMQDYFARYQDAAAPAHYCAPRLDEGYEVEGARRRIAWRAGLLHAADGERIGALRGYVDEVSAHRIAGWAQTVEHPEAPLCLDIYAGGQLIGRVLANRYRDDLARAGIGSGCHGFEFAPPRDLSAHVIEVRRSLDGAAIARASANGSKQMNLLDRFVPRVKVHRRASRA